MKKVYTLTDLAKEAGIKTNGYQAFLKDGTVIGLYNNEFIVRETENDQPFSLSPSEILPYVEAASLTNSFSLSDTQFFDRCKSQFHLSESDEEEFFELDLEESALDKLNTWLTSKKIPYKIILCEAISDVNYWLVADTK